MTNQISLFRQTDQLDVFELDVQIGMWPSNL